ncbi:MAG: FdrA family protein [Streptosporangiales bacterium]|nr:FdrA family protein [Streptosporangiales bacterium]
MTDWVTVRPGAYHDSVSLMRASRTLSELDGVETATMAMATELNRDLLTRAGFTIPGDVGPNDLVIAIRASDDAALNRARAQLDTVAGNLLGRADRRTNADAGVAAPRTVGSAARRLDASVALVSVPGPHAYVEAIDALDAGLDVVIFSDNVPVEQEVALKEEARRRGLLVMGPDCGTVVVGGVGLGFANALRGGPVGIVAASGTGAQQVACLLDAAGTGVSHVLGVGGRDLASEVAGRSTVQALAALDADPATELIVLVSKPPDPEVDRAVRQAANALSTPTLVAALGPGRDDLTAVAEKAISTLGGRPPTWPHWPAPRPQRPRPGAVRGLFAGGTLCEEAMLLAADQLGPVRSNVPLRPEWRLGSDLRAPGHVMLDFGDDRLTQGRPHPMIDSSLRTERLAAESRDPDCAVVLLDVVLGYVADPDPATTLAPAIREARSGAERDGRDLAVVASLCGTEADPQGLLRQAEALRDAGAAVFVSNAAAARHAVALIEGVRR